VTKLPTVSGERVVRALKRAGFVVLRQKGSHCSLEKITPDRTYKVVVPQHPTLAKGTLSDILKTAGLTVDEFRDLL
jgi:predicted RNA binding protein YcfA (HicA-like mRNA interferase family)